VGVARALRAVAQRRRQSRRWVRFAATFAVAASVVGVAFGGWLIGRGDGSARRAEMASSGVKLLHALGPMLITDAAGQPLSPGARLGAGTALSTADGRAELAFASGARTRVSERTDLRISEVSARETLQLARGRVDVEVPHRPAPAVFSVKTPDALVVVHGTSFSVAVDPLAAGIQTSVAVARGVVAVHSGGKEVRLVAGERWPAIEVSAAAPAEDHASEPITAQASETSTAPPPAKSRAARQAARRAAAAESALSEENELFAAAMAEKKAGDFASALRKVESFLSRYPRSVLLQEAEVERFRLLSRLGRTREAARHARQYLGEYRDGYARDEAREVALGEP
jgi:hypothetical protein